MPSKFKPPVKEQPGTEFYYSDRLKRIIRAHEQVSQEYVPSKQEDQKEIVTAHFAHKHPENTRRTISRILRVLLPKKDMFVTDMKGTPQKEFKVKQALVYRLNEYVYDPRNAAEVLSSSTSKVGYFSKPLVRYTYNKEGQIIDSTIIGNRNKFYIEYTPETVKKLLEEYETEHLMCMISTAKEQGNDFHEPRAVSIFNLQEFIEVEDIEGLTEANKFGYLSKDYGGYDLFRSDREKINLERAKKLRANLDRK